MPPSALPSPASSQGSAVVSFADAERAMAPVSPRVAQLLRPTQVIPRYSDHGFEGEIELWQPQQINPSDVPELIRQLQAVEAVMAPAAAPTLLARIFALLSHYRERELPSHVEAALAEDWLDDLGEFPEWIIREACRLWRRHPTKYRYKPLPGDIRALCLEVAGRLPIVADRLRRLLATAPAASTRGSISDIRSRVIALAEARRMP